MNLRALKRLSLVHAFSNSVDMVCLLFALFGQRMPGNLIRMYSSFIAAYQVFFSVLLLVKNKVCTRQTEAYHTEECVLCLVTLFFTPSLCEHENPKWPPRPSDCSISTGSVLFA